MHEYIVYSYKYLPTIMGVYQKGLHFVSETLILINAASLSKIIIPHALSIYYSGWLLSVEWNNGGNLSNIKVKKHFNVHLLTAVSSETSIWLWDL